MSDAITKPKIVERSPKKRVSNGATAELFPDTRPGEAQDDEEIYDPSSQLDEAGPVEPKPEPVLEKPETVPSIFPGRDPEFSRPIFTRKRLLPGEVVDERANEGIAKPHHAPLAPKIKPRRLNTMTHVPPSPLPLKKVETGILGLDNRIGGLSVGSFNCVSGIEAVNRSQLIAHIAERVAAQDERVLAVISPHEEYFWTTTSNLMVRVSVQFTVDDLTRLVEDAGKVDMLVIDPLHSLQTPPEQERIAAMDYTVTQLAIYARRKRMTILAVPHPVDRASGHEGVSLHPWMFREISCLLELSELILMVRTHRMGRQEILAYRRGMQNRIGGLPSFVIPWS